MGNRFITNKYPDRLYSKLGVTRRINEGDFEYHAMRPYGSKSSKFQYLNRFEKKHQTRLGNKRVRRACKKTARRSSTL